MTEMPGGNFRFQLACLSSVFTETRLYFNRKKVSMKLLRSDCVYIGSPLTGIFSAGDRNGLDSNGFVNGDF